MQFPCERYSTSDIVKRLTLEQIFWKTKTFLKKLEYRLLVESTTIENTSLTYNSVISEANVKTNRIVSTKWTYYKNGVLPVNPLLFWKFCSSLRTFYKELFWCTNHTNYHVRTFWERWSFICRCFFICEYP